MMGAYSATSIHVESCPNCGYVVNTETPLTISRRTDGRFIDDYLPIPRYEVNNIILKKGVVKEKQKIIHDYNWDLNYKNIKKYPIQVFVAKPLYHLARDRIHEKELSK